MSPDKQVDISHLISQVYNMGELKKLSYALAISWEELPGETLSAKVRELIMYSERHGRFNDLLTQLRKERPLVPWPDIFFDDQQHSSTSPFPVVSKIRNLVGQEKIIEGIANELRNGRTCVLYGTSGVGKTATAIELAYLLREEFTEGVLWADLKDSIRHDGTLNETAVAAILSDFAHAYGLDISQLDDIASRKEKVLGLLTNKRVLIIVDDAHGTLDAEYFLPPTIGKCAALITTRNRRTLRDVAVSFPITPFTEDQGLQLLRDLAGKERIDQNIAGAARIAKLLGGLPLALNIVGSDLEGMPAMSLDDYAQSLIDERSEEDYLKDMDNESKSVFASFEKSFQRLEPVTQQLFIRLAVFHGLSFSVEAVAVIFQLSPRRAHKQIGLLHTRSLIEYGHATHHEEHDISGNPKRYRLHTLLQVFAEQKLIQNEELYAETMQRTAIYFADFVEKNSLNYPALAAEWKNIWPTLQWAHEQKQWALLHQGGMGLTKVNLGAVGFLDAQGYWREAEEMLGWLLENPDLMEDTLPRAVILFKLGVFHFRRAGRQQAKALWQESLTVLATQPATQEGLLLRAYVCEFMAQLESEQNTDDALVWAQKSMATIQQLSDESVFEHDRGYLLIRLATIFGRKGQPEQAFALVHEGLTLLPDTPSSARISGHMTLGTLHHMSGDEEKGVEQWQAAVADAKTLGNRLQQARLQHNLAIHEAKTGQLNAGIALNREALQAYEAIGDVNGVGHIHSNLGFIYALRREVAAAQPHVEMAETIARTHSNPDLLIVALGAKARLQVQQNYFDEATITLHEAQQLSEELGKKGSLPEILQLQARMALHTTVPETALTLLNQAQEKAHETRSEYNLGNGRYLEGEIRQAMKQIDLAIEAYQAGIELFPDGSCEQAYGRFALARLYLDMGEPDKAHALLTAVQPYFEAQRMHMYATEVQSMLTELPGRGEVNEYPPH